MRGALWFLAGLIPSAIAAPLSLGIKFSTTNGLPTLTLPYATYTAYLYDVTDDVSVPLPRFRTGRVLTGGCSTTLSRISDSRRLPLGICAGQSRPLLLRRPRFRTEQWAINACKQLRGSSLVWPSRKPVNSCSCSNSPASTVAYPILQSLEPASEDCLFLDIQVPGKAVRGEVKNLPVLFWLFGGGYGWFTLSLAKEGTADDRCNSIGFEIVPSL